MNGRPSHHPSRRRTSTFLGVSVGLHLAAALALLLALPDEPLSVSPTIEIDVDASELGQAPGTKMQRRAPADRATRDHRQPHRSLGAKSSGRTEADHPSRSDDRSRRPGDRRRDSGGRLPAPVDDERGKQPACSDLLSMRGCNDDKASSSGGPADRLAAFGPRHRRQARVPVTARLRHRGLEMQRYADGGRLVRRLGDRRAPPGIGEIGLLRLASTPIGGSSHGRQACDVYRHRGARGNPDRRGEQRLLVLLLDTSGSVAGSGRAPLALVCAAGATLSALQRGYRVALVNFSTETRYLRPTRDAEVLYRVISHVQGASTRLPPIGSLQLPTRDPRDLVLITDTAIDNLESVLPGYRAALARHRRDRGVLFVLGPGQRKSVASIRQAGFAPDRVQHQNDSLFARYAASALRGLTRPVIP